MPTSISHIGGRARVNEPGRYRKKNNKNLMAQGVPTFIGMPQPLRNLIAKRVKPSQAISNKKKTQSQLRTTNNLVPCSAVIEAAALTGPTYTKDFPDIDIYGDGELYTLTVTVKNYDEAQKFENTQNKFVGLYIIDVSTNRVYRLAGNPVGLVRIQNGLKTGLPWLNPRYDGKTSMMQDGDTDGFLGKFLDYA